MRVPLEWLYEYCRPGLEVGQLADRLTLTGTNVESIEHHGVGELDKFIVGRVLQAERHVLHRVQVVEQVEGLEDEAEAPAPDRRSATPSALRAATPSKSVPSSSVTPAQT